MGASSDMNLQALSAADVASMLGVSQNLVYKLAREGEIPSYHVGRKLRFTADAIDAYRRGNVSSAASSEERDDEHLSRITQPKGKADIQIGGKGPVTDLLANYLDAFGMNVHREFRSGYASLVSMYMGACDVAVVSLWDRASDTCNLPYIQRLMPGVPLTVFSLGKTSYGFVVKAGNPHSIKSWPDLLKEGIVLANRDPGSAARILLDEHLIGLEAVPSYIRGYSRAFHSELALGTYVSRETGDVGVATERLFHQVDGLDYLPLHSVEMALVIRKTLKTRRVIPLLRNLLRSKQYGEQLASVPGLDTSRAGRNLYEV